MRISDWSSDVCSSDLPQFLPSVYLQVAEDGDGDGVARIWSSEADAIESIGAYLRRSRARAGPQGRLAVQGPAGYHSPAMARRLQPTASTLLVASYCPGRPIAETPDKRRLGTSGLRQIR